MTKLVAMRSAIDVMTNQASKMATKACRILWTRRRFVSRDYLEMIHSKTSPLT